MGTLPLSAGRLLNPSAEVTRLGLGGFQEVVFHGRLRGGGSRGNGKGDFPNIGGWQCSFCSALHCWNTRYSSYRCGPPRPSSRYLEGDKGVLVECMARVLVWFWEVRGREGFFKEQGGVGEALGGVRVLAQLVVISLTLHRVSLRFGKVLVQRVAAKEEEFQERVLEAGIGCDLVGFKRLRVDRVMRGKACWSCSFSEGPGTWCVEDACGGSRSSRWAAGARYGGGVVAPEACLPCPFHPNGCRDGGSTS